MAGLKADQIAASRQAASVDPRADATLKFAVAVVADRGAVSDEQFAKVRAAGLTEGEVAEILAHVALNVFTNYLNEAALTVVDFPRVDSAGKAV
jgi:alkylhydroperoxidase family enzyme